MLVLINLPYFQFRLTLFKPILLGNKICHRIWEHWLSKLSMYYLKILEAITDVL